LVKTNKRRGPPWESPDVPDDAYYDGQLATMAVESLHRLKNLGKPFFLGVGFQKPHLPFCVPKKYWDLYDAKTLRLSPVTEWPTGSPVFAHESFGEVRSYDGTPQSGPISHELALRLIHGYYASVSYVDAQIGKVLDALPRLGLDQNTIVVFWGDNGWKLSEYSSWSKSTNYEIDTHIPMVLRYPGMPNRGGQSMALVELLDVYPTLCDLAELPSPKHLEGTSMRPVVAQPGRPGKPAAFSQYPRPGLMGYTMRTDQYRLTLWTKAGDPQQVAAVELYDHQKDADLVERVNLAMDPERQELVEQLTQQLRQQWPWRKQP
jgi:arylsulfatase A-like enzyme